MQAGSWFHSALPSANVRLIVWLGPLDSAVTQDSPANVPYIGEAALEQSVQGVDNSVDVARSAQSGGFTLDIRGNSNRVSVSAGADVSGFSLKLRDDSNQVEIGPGARLRGEATVRGAGSLRIGARTTFERSNLICTGANISIGADCMFAADVEIRTTDSHPIFDLVSHQRINFPQDVTIEDYVWCGKRVFVVKGSRIGTGSIVGLGSVVSGELPAFALAVGVPSRPVRRNVTWTRHTRDSVLAEDGTAMGYLSAAWSPQMHDVQGQHEMAPRSIVRVLLEGSRATLVDQAGACWRQLRRASRL